MQTVRPAEAGFQQRRAAFKKRDDGRTVGDGEVLPVFLDYATPPNGIRDSGIGNRKESTSIELDFVL